MVQWMKYGIYDSTLWNTVFMIQLYEIRYLWFNSMKYCIYDSTLWNTVFMIQLYKIRYLWFNTVMIRIHEIRYLWFDFSAEPLRIPNFSVKSSRKIMMKCIFRDLSRSGLKMYNIYHSVHVHAQSTFTFTLLWRGN